MVWDLLPASPQGVVGVPLLAALACCLSVAPGGAAGAAEALTLKRVMLSSGGVGYFEHEAAVEGADAELTLPVRLDQVADVLKSIVVLDPAGGRGTVSLPGREPLAQAFRDLPFEAGALESLVSLLDALRGAEVRVTGARAIEGRLLGVTPEVVRLPDGQEVTTRHRVGVMTTAGVQQFVLEEAASVAFVDPGLRAQVEAGLAALAAHRARDRRTLRIDVAGGRGGERTVRVAYVVGVPLWKSSYRLTLPAAAAEGDGGADAAARLQGWAVVENMSGQDWDGVELTFLSGNPVTFRQDLYSAYYVDRPEVPVEVLGRVLPPADVGTVAGAAGAAAAAGPRSKAAAEMAPSRALMAPAPPMAAARESYAAMADEAASAPPGAPFAAEAEEAATQVVFRFPEPVGVASGHSLMLPIIDRDVPAERLALYQPETHATHPLATVRLTNDGDTGLPPGVLTLYERGGGAAAGDGGGATTYVGDARLGALPAGEERLVSFALDQKTRIDREDRGEQRIASGRISRGVLELTVFDEQTTLYRLRAPAREDRLVVIEHPRRPGWDLVEPAPTEGVELTPEDYRVRRALEAGREERVSVVVRRPRVERLELLNLSVDDLALYARTGSGLAEPVRQAFARMAELRAEIDRRERRLDELEGRREAIVAEQERIRANLARVPAEGDLHRRYLNRLNAQEDELERLVAEMEAAREELDRARDALRAYVAGLEL